MLQGTQELGHFVVIRVSHSEASWSHIKPYDREMIQIMDTALSRYIHEGLFLVQCVVVGTDPVLEPTSRSTYLHFINEEAVTLAVHFNLSRLCVRLWHKVF